MTLMTPMTPRRYLLLASLAALAAGPPDARAQSDSARIRTGADGITYKPGAGKTSFRLGGRLHLEGVSFNGDSGLYQDDWGVRRARLYIAGRLGDDWRFMVDRDIGGTSTGWKSVWIGYNGIRHVRLRAGQMVAPMGMEELSAAGDIPFVERGLPTALVPGLLTGVQANYAHAGWTASLGYFGNPINVEFGKSSATGRSRSGRLTWAPLRSHRNTLHLGLSIERRNIDPGSLFRIASAPETGLTRTTLFNTGNLAGVQDLRRRGYELAWESGPLQVQAESITMDVTRLARPTAHFTGWYAQASWMLTGESRPYAASRGTFGGIDPRHHWGALELAIRRSHLDLEDGRVTGGRGTDDSVGVNWYLGRNLRLMGDYTRSHARPDRSGLVRDIGLYQASVQVDF